MLIRVEYKNGNFDMVKPQILNKLLAARRVTKFWRDSGWAYVGRNYLRSNYQQFHLGNERRTMDA